MTPHPRRALDPSCVSPSKSQVPFPGSLPWWASGFLHAISAVLVGCMRRPKRAHRLGSTAMILRASPSNAPSWRTVIRKAEQQASSLQAWPSCLLAPCIQHMVEEYMGQEGGNDPAWHDACLGRRQAAFFQHACPPPLPHEAPSPPILAPRSPSLASASPVDAIAGSTDIGLHDPAHARTPTPLA
jgi:hypothetical protein